MREMKESGISWIGSVPSDWKLQRNKRIMKKVKEIRPRYTGEDVLSLTMSGVIKRDLDNPYGKMPTTFDGYQYVTEGNLLMCLFDIDVTPRCIGLIKENGVTSPAYSQFEMLNGNYAPYYYYYYLYLDHRKELLHLAKNLRHSFTEEQLGELFVPVPPVSEQRRITDYLDFICSKIDSVIEKQEAIIEKLKEYKLSIITETVTKGLNKNIKLKDSKNSALGKIAETWDSAQLKYLHDGLTDGTHGTYERLDSGRLLLSSKNVREESLEIGENESYISEEDFKEITSCGFPRKNDVLLCCIGASIGRCILYEWDQPEAFQRSVIMIRSGKRILPKYLLYSMRSTTTLLQEQLLVNQSAQPGLYQGLVSRIYLAVPSLKEQEEITNYLDNKTSEINNSINIRERIVEKLREYKKSLIYEVVTGKKEI